MNEIEYKKLEKLLSKLSNSVNAQRICIYPGYLHDGYHIGAYNPKGELIAQATCADLKQCVEEINKLM